MSAAEKAETGRKWDFAPEEVSDVFDVVEDLEAVEERLRVHLGIDEGDRKHVRDYLVMMSKDHKLEDNDLTGEWHRLYASYHHYLEWAHHERAQAKEPK